MPWYHGNLHCHSTNSDQYTPVEAYSDEGILTIPCCEYTGKEYCHVLAVGVTQAVSAKGSDSTGWH